MYQKFKIIDLTPITLKTQYSSGKLVVMNVLLSLIKISTSIFSKSPAMKNKLTWYLAIRNYSLANTFTGTYDG